jgi:hypothetical protein
MARQNIPDHQKGKPRTANDYAGGSDHPQSLTNPAPQKGMIDDDMGKYGGVEQKKTPKEVDPEHRKVAGRR